MTKYLSKQKIPFTMVCNQIIFDVRISSKAKFYYVYLSSKPEGWEFHTNAIIKEIKEGKDAFYSGLQELEEFGYLERIQKRIDGKFGSTEYSLLVPNNFSYTEKSDTVKSDTEKPDYNNIYSNKKDVTNKDCIALQEQSNFSKNENPNNALSELSLKDFQDFWQFTLLRQAPSKGFEAEFDKFTNCWNNMLQGSKESKYNNDWRNYLRAWIKHDYNVKPKKESQPTQSASQAPQVITDSRIPCVEIPIKKPEVKEVNRVLPDKIVESAGNYYWFKKVFVVDWDYSQTDNTLRVDMVCTSKKNIDTIKTHYWGKFGEAVKYAVKLGVEYRSFDLEINLTLPPEGECKEINLIY